MDILLIVFIALVNIFLLTVFIERIKKRKRDKEMQEKIPYIEKIREFPNTKEVKFPIRPKLNISRSERVKKEESTNITDDEYFDDFFE